jgi:hypothetical protein
MAKVTVKKFDVYSVAKVYAVIGVVIGFFIGLMIAIFAGLGSAASDTMGFPGVGLVGMGVAAIVVAPIVYGIMMFISGAVSALIYNFVAQKIGGVVFESK